MNKYLILIYSFSAQHKSSYTVGFRIRVIYSHYSIFFTFRHLINILGCVVGSSSVRYPVRYPIHNSISTYDVEYIIAPNRRMYLSFNHGQDSLQTVFGNSVA